MANTNINSTFTYNANFSQANAQIAALAKRISMLNASFNSLSASASASQKAMAASFAGQVAAIGGFKTSMVDITNATDQFGKALAKNKLTLRQYYQEAARMAVRQNALGRKLAQEQVKMMQSTVIGMGEQGGRGKAMVVRPLSIDTSDFNTKMQLATKQWSVFNALVSGGAQKLIDWGKNTQWAGRQLTVGLTVPLTIFAATVSKTFRDVDKELTRFAKVYGSDLVQANAAATEQMKQQVQDLAIEFAKQYGITASETVSLAADIAATGQEGQKLMESVKQTTRLAVLGEVDRQEAMKATLAIQSAFRYSTDELAESIDFLNAVENQTSATLQDFSAAIPKAGPVVRALGGDIKDLAAMLTAMREGGIPAAEAANAIKSGLASMINPTKKASEVAQQFGVDLEGIVSANRGQLMPTLLSLQSSLDKLDSFARAKIIEEIFGKYQFARISALFDNIGKAGSQTEQVFKLMGASSTELARIADGEIKTLTESASMRFQRAMEGIKASLLPVGQVMTEIIIPVLEKGATAITKITEAFSNLPEPVKNAVKLLTGLVAVAGPFIMMAGVLGNFLGYMQKGILSLVNFGRKMVGLPTEKFELLDDQQIAAARASDILSSSFDRQRTNLIGLNNAMIAYLANLGRFAQQNPAMLTGTTTTPPPRTSTRRRSLGGNIPGYGGGDRVPAMLEPGEFVVRKEQARKFGPILGAINNGNIRGYQGGGEVYGGGFYANGKARTGAPASARANFITNEERQAIAQRSEQLLREIGLWNGLNERQRRDMVSADLAHIVPEIDPRTGEKIWRRGNVFASSGLENKALEYLFGARRTGNRTMFTNFFNSIAKTPQEREMVTRIIGQNNHPRNAQEMQFLLRGFGMMGKNPETRSWLEKRSSAARYYLPALQAMLVEKVASEKGLSVRGRAPLFGLTGTMGTTSPTSRIGSLVSQVRSERASGIRTGWISRGPRGTSPIAAHPGETLVPSTLAQDGAYVDKNGNVSPLKRGMANRGTAMMNAGMMAMFALPMLGQMNEGMAEATNKLTMFSAAVMTAGMAMQMFSGVGGMMGKGGGGLLGMKGAGRRLTTLGRARNIAGVGQGVAGMGGMAARGGTSALLMGGRALSVLGGPIGIAVGLGISAAIVGWIKYQESIEKAKDSAKAALETSEGLAKQLGVEAKSAAEGLNSLKATLDSIRSGENVEPPPLLSDEMKQQVTTDYEALIEKLKNISSGPAGQELIAAYSSMIAKGFDQTQAKAIIDEIARQAQKTEVVISIKAKLSEIETPEDALRAQEQYLAEQSNIPDYVGTLREQDKKISDEMRLISSKYQNFDIFGFSSQVEEYKKALKEGLPIDQFSQDVKRYGDLENQSAKISKEILTLGKSVTYAEELIPPAIRNIMSAMATEPSLAIKSMTNLMNSIISVTDDEERRKKLDAAAGEMEAQLANVGADPATIQAFQKLADQSETAADAMIVFNAVMAGVPGIGQMAADGLSAAELAFLKIKTQANLAAVGIKQLSDEFSALAQTELDELSQVQSKATQVIDDKISAINDEVEARRESAQEASDALAKENEALQEQQKTIQENTDARTKLIDKQIESLEKSKETAAFEEEQRRRGIGALSALAQGDIAGFMQAQSEMEQQAQERSKDLAVEALQERQKAIQEESDARIKAIQDQIDANDKLNSSIQDGIQAFEKAARERIKVYEKDKQQLAEIFSKPQEVFDKIMKDGIVTEAEAEKLSKSFSNALEKAGAALGEKFPKIQSIVSQASSSVGNELTKQYKGFLQGLIDTMTTTLGLEDDQALILIRSEFNNLTQRYNYDESDKLSMRRANGGYVARGKGYLVGERGPEYFQPFQSGMVTPNGQLPGFAAGGLIGNPFYASIPTAVESFINKVRPKSSTQKTSRSKTGMPMFGELDNVPSIKALLDKAFQKYDYLPYGLGTTPDAGNIGCSGFTSYILSKAGISTPAYSPSQFADNDFIKIPVGKQLQVGDLMFWHDPNATGRLARAPGQPNHVGFYYGNGKILHSSGGKGVNVQAISNSPDDWYNRNYIGARRAKKWNFSDPTAPQLRSKPDGSAPRSPRVAENASFSNPYLALSSFKNGGMAGKISGPGSGTSDSILARVSNGEYIIRASSAARIGTKALDYMNQRGTVPGFARGGMVSPSFSAPSQNTSMPTGAGNSAVYNINVNVSGSTVSADEIANKVFAKAKQRENARSLNR